VPPPPGPSVGCLCASLPDESIGFVVESRPDLRAALDAIDAEAGLALYYRCRLCGAHWEDNLASAMHASVPVF
jgi:hypothetical protein